MSQAKNIKGIQRVIEELGLETIATITRSAKSISVVINGPTGTRKMFAPCTPSDHRNFLNVKRDMRRVAISAGLEL